MALPLADVWGMARLPCSIHGSGCHVISCYTYLRVAVKLSKVDGRG